jgi:hypothetical protein
MRFLAACVCLIAAVASAQTTRPATMPFDQSTPRSAVKKLASAVEQGDPAAVREVLLAETPLQERFVELMASLSSVTADLRAAGEDMFGREAGGAIVGHPDAFPEILKRVDESLERLHDDWAIVTTGEGDEIQLVLRDGTWRVPVDQLVGNVTDDVLEAYLEEGEEQVAILRELAREVAQGRFRSSQEAEQVLHARMMRGATQPSTNPAEPPKE